MRKVHDSIAFDERIEINSDAFPTRWWGPPHIPNMCYTKELRYSGGPNDDSSFMRIHLTRTEGSQGGMAYGVYPQVELGDQVTLSFWARSSMVRGWSWSAYFGGGFQGASGSINSTEEWQRFEYTWIASNTFGFYIYFWPGNPNVLPYYVDLADIQAEVNKGHATTFTLTERTATDSLIDITGNNTIDLTNVSFDSNAQMTFDGTDDYAEAPDSNVLDITSEVSFEFVVNADAIQSNPYPRLLDKSIYLVHLSQTAPFSIAQNITTSDGLRQVSVGSAVPANTLSHIITTYNGTVGKIYVNGSLVATNSWDTFLPCNVNGSTLKIGGDGGTGRPLNGELPVVKIYNRALTASEIKANFNAIKGRFNIE